MNSKIISIFLLTFQFGLFGDAVLYRSLPSYYCANDKEIKSSSRWWTWRTYSTKNNHFHFSFLIMVILPYDVNTWGLWLHRWTFLKISIQLARKFTFTRPITQLCHSFVIVILIASLLFTNIYNIFIYMMTATYAQDIFLVS